MKKFSFWFITGSQNLYGEDVLKKVAEDSQEICRFFSEQGIIRHEIIFKPVVKNSQEIAQTFTAACADENCAGVITWMHTFSPSKMWINGIKLLTKPVLHLHTQFEREIPWDSIDMNFMNTNQSAHGDREHGYIHTRMGVRRKVIAGHYQDASLINRLGRWLNIAAAAYDCRNIRIMRIGDNMRDVAVTEGDKVDAQITLGWSVNTHGTGELARRVTELAETRVDSLIQEYKEKFDLDQIITAEQRSSVRYQAKLELALEDMLLAGEYNGITTTFEDLYGLEQLPGLAIQRLMEKGYGFGPEGDWKTSALVRLMKQMTENAGTSLMEDYTYHLESGNEMVLGSHMLEICPSLSADKAKVEVHPLNIGGKADPARLVFDGKEGSAICVSLIDLGNRFRLIIQDVNAVKPPKAMPKLPVARIMWKPEPDLITSAEAWIYAGGAHHTSFSYALTAEDMIDFADILGVETVHIGKTTNICSFKQELEIKDLIAKLK